MQILLNNLRKIVSFGSKKLDCKTSNGMGDWEEMDAGVCPTSSFGWAIKEKSLILVEDENQSWKCVEVG